jgi:hypothetical protein
MRVACRWLEGRDPLAIRWLWGGFDVALAGLRRLPPLFLLSTFCSLLSLRGGFILHSAFAPAWLWPAFPAIPQSAFRIPHSPQGGFAGPFDVRCWMFDVGCSGPVLK